MKVCQSDNRNNRPTARQDSQRKEFLFFSDRIFCFLIFANRTSGTFGFARHTYQRFTKPKEPLLQLLC
jgi:nitrate reductase NapE component